MSAQHKSSLFNTTDQTFHVNRSDAFIVKAAMRRTTFSSVWSGVLFTLVIALVLLSTKQQRRGAIFYIQCVAFPLAITYNALCILYAYWEQQNIFIEPGEETLTGKQVHVQVTTLSLEHWVPLLSDLALLYKFAGFYPAKIYSSSARVKRLGPLVLLLIPQLATTIAFTYAASAVYLHPRVVAGQARPVYAADHVNLLMRTGTLSFALQVPYGLYAAVVLVYKTLGFRRNTTQHRGSGISRKLRYFLETVFMTNIPPVAFSLACAIQLNCPSQHYCAFRELSGTHLNSSVAFSLLATSWSTIRSRRLISDKQQDAEAADVCEGRMLISQVVDPKPHASDWSSETSAFGLGHKRHSGNGSSVMSDSGMRFDHRPSVSDASFSAALSPSSRLKKAESATP